MNYNITLNPTSVLLADADNFEAFALEVFRYQHAYSIIYRAYCDALHIRASAINSLTKIPFLPISFFKTHKVITENRAAGPANRVEAVFESSSTTGSTSSRHYVRDLELYEKALLQGFEQFYGLPAQYAVLALLPSYIERKNASLTHMAKVLMEHSGHEANGFYINEWERLHEVLNKLNGSGQKTLLLGVTFALLDFASAYPGPLTNTIVMETGGMKGRRQELTREEVHTQLKKQWHLKNIHSEYGMTELLSQAYATTNGVFKCTNTMRVLISDLNDPLDTMPAGTGNLNIIDLANIHSCSFIATEDIGHLYADGTFEVLGRTDHTALRGCSLMAV